MDTEEARKEVSGFFSDACEDWGERGGNFPKLLDAVLSLTETRTVRDKVIEILLNEVDRR